MNIVDVVRRQLATRMDNTIKDTENTVDIATEEGYGVLDYVDDIQNRFSGANSQLIQDIKRLVR